jgi:VWFA-related protein
MNNAFTHRAVSALLAFAFLIAPAAAIGQSRRTPPQEPQKKNTRPGDQPTDTQQPSQEPVPPDVIKDKETEVVKVSSNIVQIEAVVIDKKSKRIITGLKKENFAIFEDGVQKEVANFATPEAPITVAVVLEYSRIGQIQAYYGSSGTDRSGMEEMLGPTVMFLQQFIRPPDDYVSVIAYDMRPTPLTDFTNDPARISQVINVLARNRPVSSEANLFDALKLTLIGGRADSVALENSEKRTTDYGGMVDIQGRRKAVFLITTGRDTFSKINLDAARKIVQNAGIPIYIVGTGELFFKKYGDQLPAEDGLSGSTDPGRMSLLQDRNTLRTFAKESGGEYFPVTFPGELPSTLQTINALMRNQYSLAYSTGERRDGKKHKIEVKVDVNGDGKYDDKDFDVKARQFYNSPKS